MRGVESKALVLTRDCARQAEDILRVAIAV